MRHAGDIVTHNTVTGWRERCANDMRLFRSITVSIDTIDII